MATSGVTAGTMTVQQIVTRAMKELGVLSSGEVPTAEEGADALESLNWMLKSWQAKGCNLWRDAEATLTLAPTVGSTALPGAPLDAFDVRVIQTGNIERMLTRWEAGEYAALPNKAAAGVPTIYTLVKGTGSTILKVWPVPTVSTTLAYHVARVVEDVTALTETLDIPQMWLETVWMNLAARLVTTFGAARTDPGAAQRVTAYAAALEQTMLDFDRPASVFMGPAYSRGRY